MTKIRTLATIVAFLALLPAGARADAFAKGMEAYEARKFETARKVFQTLAEAGDARAQYWFGAMTEFGIGGAA